MVVLRETWRYTSFLGKSVRRAGLWGLVASGLTLASGCATPRYRQVAVVPGVSTLLTEADTRLVSVRPNPNGANNPNILCAEPSPDVAKALSLAMKAEAKVATPSGTTIGSGAGYGSSEALMTLAGRTTTVVALRDGLYRACEAYANGIIGRSAYAMILSQYGDLLVTLMLGESAARMTAIAPGTVKADKIEIDIDSAAPPSVKKTDGTDKAPEQTTTDAAFVPAVWSEAIATGLQPVSMTTILPDEPAPAAPDAGETPAKTVTSDAAVSRIAEMYWDNILLRSLRSNFVTCVTAAERQPEGDLTLQTSLRSMCTQLFAAYGAQAEKIDAAQGRSHRARQY